MFKNNFKTAWRSLLKNKFYSAIKIFGLAVGLTTGILLLLWMQNELSFDRFSKKYPDIYQLNAHLVENGGHKTWCGVPCPLSVYAKSIPQVLRKHSVMRQLPFFGIGGGLDAFFCGHPIYHQRWIF
jgi:putative ABC transport system permease protein